MVSSPLSVAPPARSPTQPISASTELLAARRSPSTPPATPTLSATPHPAPAFPRQTHFNPLAMPAARMTHSSFRSMPIRVSSRLSHRFTPASSAATILIKLSPSLSMANLLPAPTSPVQPAQLTLFPPACSPIPFSLVSARHPQHLARLQPPSATLSSPSSARLPQSRLLPTPAISAAQALTPAWASPSSPPRMFSSPASPHLPIFRSFAPARISPARRTLFSPASIP